MWAEHCMEHVHSKFYDDLPANVSMYMYATSLESAMHQ